MSGKSGIIDGPGPSDSAIFSREEVDLGSSGGDGQAKGKEVSLIAERNPDQQKVGMDGELDEYSLSLSRNYTRVLSAFTDTFRVHGGMRVEDCYKDFQEKVRAYRHGLSAFVVELTDNKALDLWVKLSVDELVMNFVSYDLLRLKSGEDQILMDAGLKDADAEKLAKLEPLKPKLEQAQQENRSLELSFEFKNLSSETQETEVIITAKGVQVEEVEKVWHKVKANEFPDRDMDRGRGTYLVKQHFHAFEKGEADQNGYGTVKYTAKLSSFAPLKEL